MKKAYIECKHCGEGRWYGTGDHPHHKCPECGSVDWQYIDEIAEVGK